MPDAPVLTILNDLLAATKNSPLAHLSESATFFSFADADLAEMFQTMIVEEKEHAAALADLLLDLGAGPRPAPPDVHTAELHYLELQFLLPRVLKSEEGLLAAYESARAGLTGAESPQAPRALEVVSRLEARQRRHVEILGKLVAQTRAALIASS